MQVFQIPSERTTMERMIETIGGDRDDVEVLRARDDTAEGDGELHVSFMALDLVS